MRKPVDFSFAELEKRLSAEARRALEASPTPEAAGATGAVCFSWTGRTGPTTTPSICTAGSRRAAFQGMMGAMSSEAKFSAQSSLLSTLGMTALCATDLSFCALMTHPRNKGRSSSTSGQAAENSRG